jgi:hypothetical protein
MTERTGKAPFLSYPDFYLDELEIVPSQGILNYEVWLSTEILPRTRTRLVKLRGNHTKSVSVDARKFGSIPALKQCQKTAL